MKTLFSLTIAINNLKVADPEDTVTPKVNLDNFQLDLKHEVDMQPEEYTAAVNNLGKLFSTMVLNLAKPSHMVNKVDQPNPIVEEKITEDAFTCQLCHRVPAAPFSTICTECAKGGN